MVGVHVHLGDLERVTQPGQGVAAAAHRAQRVPHQIVPPLAVFTVEAVGKGDDRATALGVSCPGVVPVRQARPSGHSDSVERRMAGVPFHDRPTAR